MDEYQVKLSNISKKIGVLIGRYNELTENYRMLEDENRHLKQQIKSQAVKNDYLTEQLNVVKLSKAISDDDDDEKAELKKKINEFIKEIDKCVALLND